MGKGKVKFTPFLPTQTTKVIDRRKNLNEEHVRLSKSMVKSKAFKNLTANSILLYLMLRMKFFKEEAKKEEFEVSQAYATELLGYSQNSKVSGKRAINNLCHCGFIEPTYISKGGGNKNKISNKFRFSENWKLIK